MINQSILRKALTVGITLLLAAGEAKAYDPFDPGGHHLMVKTPPGVHSIYVNGVWGDSPFLAEHVEKTYPNLVLTPDWHPVNFLALNETLLIIDTFSSPDGIFGLISERRLIVPPNDGLTYVWVDASQSGF